MATFVPLAAKAPSFSSAGGSAASGTRVHVFPPSAVVMITKRPLTESLTATPRASSRNAIASKNAFGSAFVNWSCHVAPPSAVL